MTIQSKYLQLYLGQKVYEADTDYLPTLDMLEDEYINYLLELTGNDLIKTAEILNISPTTLFKKLNKIEVWV